MIDLTRDELREVFTALFQYKARCTDLRRDLLMQTNYTIVTEDDTKHLETINDCIRLTESAYAKIRTQCTKAPRTHSS